MRNPTHRIVKSKVRARDANPYLRNFRRLTSFKEMQIKTKYHFESQHHKITSDPTKHRSLQLTYLTAIVTIALSVSGGCKSQTMPPVLTLVMLFELNHLVFSSWIEFLNVHHVYYVYNVYNASCLHWMLLR